MCACVRVNRYACDCLYLNVRRYIHIVCMCMCECVNIYFMRYVGEGLDVCVCLSSLNTYGVATISRVLKIVGLFCRILSVLLGSFAKETYHFKEPTNRSHPIVCSV